MSQQGRPEGPLRWFGEEMDEDTFRQAMIEGRRLIYEFHVKAYGLP